MPAFGCWGLPTALLALLCCPGTGENTFDVHVWSEKQAIEFAGSFKVNCSTSCAKPEAAGLETLLPKKELEGHPQKRWQQYLLSNVSQDTVLLCYFTCNGKQRSKSLNIRVYEIPKNVTLKLQPLRVIVGQTFTIECKASPVKPLRSLTLALLCGQDRVQSHTFEKAPPTLQEATVTFNRTAPKKGNLNFSCQAELDMRPYGGYFFHSTSEHQILEVYDTELVIIIVVVSVLLLLFVTSVLFCFIFGQHWHQKRTGSYGVLNAWRRLSRSLRARVV